MLVFVKEKKDFHPSVRFSPSPPSSIALISDSYPLSMISGFFCWNDIGPVRSDIMPFIGMTKIIGNWSDIRLIFAQLQTLLR